MKNQFTNLLCLFFPIVVGLFNLTSLNAQSTNSNEPLTQLPVEYLVVAGGGSGGSATNTSNYHVGGGGGGGAILNNTTTLMAGSVYVAVGAGGNSVTGNTSGNNGGNSQFGTVIATGGGGGGGYNTVGKAGGNGGGGGGPSGSNSTKGGGVGTQGNNGGFGRSITYSHGGGGGGASASPVSGWGPERTGGVGIINTITGIAYMYGSGGWGGFGASTSNGSNGILNTGNGGGGGSKGGTSGAGGSGIVVIAYPGHYPDIVVSSGLSYTKTVRTSDGYKVFKFTSGTGNITIPEIYTITYNANGVISSAPSNEYRAANEVATIAENSGSVIESGSSFIGWNTKADGTGTTYLPGHTIVITSDTTLYALSQKFTAQYLAVAGGGSGGTATNTTNYHVGGGGGGGSVISGTTPLSFETINISVGTGGIAVTGNTSGNTGGNSRFGTNIVNGGGGGGGYNTTGKAGGNGGGGGGPSGANSTINSGIGTQGFKGGLGRSITYSHGGGGGGAGASPVSGWGPERTGGVGINSSITGVPVMYGSGGLGGFGASTSNGSNGTSNTGNGGGGGSKGGTSGAGASGIVIVAYPGIYPDLVVDATLSYTKSIRSTDGAKVFSFKSGYGQIAIPQRWYSLTYNANGITSSVPLVSFHSVNETVIMQENIGEMINAGTGFVGWNTKADGSGTMYLPNSQFIINSDTTLYAIASGDGLLLNGNLLTNNSVYQKPIILERTSSLTLSDVNHSAASVFTISGAISGSGSLNINIPEHTLLLSGDNNYNGITSLQSGSLGGVGSLASSTITIEEGASLFGGMGNGTTGVLKTGSLLFKGESSVLDVYSVSSVPGVIDAGSEDILATAGFTVNINNALTEGIYTLIKTNSPVVPSILPKLGINQSGKYVKFIWVQGTGLTVNVSSSQDTQWSEVGSGDNLLYAVSSSGVSKSVEVVGFVSQSSYSEAVTIPSSITINGTTYSVTSIGKGAFYGCINLKSITIPSSVTSIQNYAFYGCSTLATITISGGVISIGHSVFKGCTALSSIAIPESVSFIGHSAFRDCINLTSITLPEKVSLVNDFTFYGCSKLQIVNLGSSVTSIGQSAFSDCIKLQTVTLPNSVKTIGELAFNNCIELLNASLPSVVNIGERAFYGALSLASVTLPASLTEIGKSCFHSCDNLSNVQVDNANNAYTSNGGCLFNKAMNTLVKYPQAKSETNYVLPSSVTTIGDYAFAKSGRLTSLNHLDHVVSVGEGAFLDCNIDSITFTGSITDIGDAVFEACSNLKQVTLPCTINSIGNYAFYKCLGLQHFYIGKSTPVSLTSNVFYMLPQNTQLHVPVDATAAYSGASQWNIFASIQGDIQDYVLQYIANGATEGVSPANNYRTACDKTLEVSGNTGNMQRTGYTFNGWNTLPDGNGIAYVPGSHYTMTNKSETLYAQWQASAFQAVKAKETLGKVKEKDENTENGTSVQAYPNPVRTAVTIDLGKIVSGESTARFYTSNGVLIKQQTLYSRLTVINVSELMAGVYNVHIMNGQESSYLRVVKY
jgi:uncharacterized repeat protein (TIGR02543 family)